MSVFANEKRNHLEQVKADGQAITKERLERDFARLNVVSAEPKQKDVSMIPEAEVVEPKKGK